MAVVKPYTGVPGEIFDIKYVPTPPFPVKKSVITIPHLAWLSVICIGFAPGVTTHGILSFFCI